MSVTIFTSHLPPRAQQPVTLSSKLPAVIQWNEKPNVAEKGAVAFVKGVFEK